LLNTDWGVILPTYFLSVSMLEGEFDTFDPSQPLVLAQGILDTTFQEVFEDLEKSYPYSTLSASDELIARIEKGIDACRDYRGNVNQTIIFHMASAFKTPLQYLLFTRAAEYQRLIQLARTNSLPSLPSLPSLAHHQAYTLREVELQGQIRCMSPDQQKRAAVIRLYKLQKDAEGRREWGTR
jgi:hypothetical protein